MNEPLVTIGIPFHNAADTLLDAVRSVFAQTYTNWELILAVDGSTDGSNELARQIRDSRVRLIGDSKRRFLPYRLNEIVRESRGQFIARMDADDLCAPDRVGKQVQFLQDHPEVDGCGTGVFAMGSDLGLVGVHRAFPQIHQEICAAPTKGIRIAHGTFLARTDWYKRNPYDEDLHQGQDWGLWLGSYRRSCFANLPEPLYLYRSVGTLSLCRYLEAKKSVARTLYKFGQREGEIIRVLLATTKILLECAVYSVLAPIGIARYLSGRRGSVPSEEERNRFQKILEAVSRTELPLSGRLDCGES